MGKIVHYDRLVRAMFLRRTAHFIKPRILDATTFTFPRASFLHYWKIEDQPYYVQRDLGLFNNTDKVHVTSIFEYPEDLETLGKFRSLTFVPNSYVDEFKKMLKEWRILKKDQEVPANDRIFKIVNYGALPGKYAYTFNPLNPYYIYKNTISTVLKNIFFFNDRRSFLVLEMPTEIPSRQLLERYIKGLKPAYFRELKSYKHFNLLELYMFIDTEYRSKSVFSLIPKDKWSNLDILFTIDNKIMAVNFNTFLAMIDGTGSFVTGIKAKKVPVFKKIFLKLIQTFIDSHAMTEVELDKLEKELDANPNIENKEDTDTEETTDTQKVEEPVKPSKPVSRWSLTNKQPDATPQNLQDILEVIKEKNKLEEDVTNDAPTRDPKKEEDDDGTGDDEEDEIEIIDEEEALYDKLVKEINTDRDNIESELDEHDNEEFLLKQQKETVTVTSLDKDLTKTEEQLKEEDEAISSLTLKEIEDMQYDYKNVENKIQALLDNKGLDKQKAKKMKDIVEKQMKSKDPYGRDKTVEDIIKSVDDFEIPEADLKITDNKVVFDKSYNNNTINTIRETYIKNHYHDDIVKMIYSLQNANVIVEEYKINPIKSQLGDLEEHVITLRTLENQTSTVKIMLPKIEPDGTIKMSGNDYVMRWQRQDLPLRKVGNSQVKLTSYYGKYFLEKAYFKTNDIGYYIMNKLAKRYTEGQGIKDLIMLPADNEAVKLPLDYAHFSRYIKSFKFKNYVFNFDYKNRIKLYKDFTPELLETLEKNNTFVLVGVQAGSPILMDYHSRLFKREAGKYIELPDLYELLEIPREEAPIEYSSIKIFKKRIPIVLLLCYYYGLANLLNILKVKYYKIEAGKRIQIQPNEYVVRFQDIKLVITRDEGLGDIIISGLLSIHKVIKTVIYKVLNDKSSFAALFSKLEYSILYVNEIKRLETLFVDPITLSILKEQKQPTNFKGLLIKANELLLDDYYKNPHDIDDMCIKGYERIAGLVYADLIAALREYDNKSAFSRAKITVKPYNVISQINEDSTTVLMDDLNPVSAIKQTEDLSYLGAQGYNKEALAKSSRIYNDSEIGIVSEAAKDNGEVGITAYLTAAPKIKNLRGKTENFEQGKDGLASVYSTSALLSPFGLMDDAKRLNKTGLVKLP